MDPATAATEASAHAARERLGPGGSVAQMFTPAAKGAAVEVLWAAPESPTILAFESFRHELKQCDVNILLVKDTMNASYQRGIVGMGSTVEEVSARLQELVPSGSRIVGAMGSSVGGMGAILYGHHMAVPQVLAFAPRTEIRAVEGRRRLQELPAGLGIDVEAVLAFMLSQPTADVLVFTGERPTPAIEVHVGEFEESDLEHALRLDGLPGVSVHFQPTGEHTLARWLQQRGELGPLIQRTFGLVRR